MSTFRRTRVAAAILMVLVAVGGAAITAPVGLDLAKWPDGWTVAAHGETEVAVVEAAGERWLEIARVGSGVGALVYWNGTPSESGLLADLAGSVVIQPDPQAPSYAFGVVLGAQKKNWHGSAEQNNHGYFIGVIPRIRGEASGRLGIWYNALTTTQEAADDSDPQARVGFSTDRFSPEQPCRLEFSVKGTEISASLWQLDAEGNKTGEAVAEITHTAQSEVAGYFGLKAGRLGNKAAIRFRDLELTSEGQARRPLRIMTIGASHSNGPHLQTLQRLLVDAGFRDYEFVGPVKKGGAPRATNRQSYGGMRLVDMLKGRTIRGIAQPGAMETVAEYQPDVFLLLGGTNNIVRTDLDAMEPIQREWTALVEYLETARPGATLFIGTIPPVHPQGKWAAKQPVIEAFNAWLKEEIARRSGNGGKLVWVDTGAGMTPEDFADDGLHLLPSGQEKIGQAWFHALKTHGTLNR